MWIYSLISGGLLSLRCITCISVLSSRAGTCWWRPGAAHRPLVCAVLLLVLTADLEHHFSRPPLARQPSHQREETCSCQFPEEEHGDKTPEEKSCYFHTQSPQWKEMNGDVLENGEMSSALSKKKTKGRDWVRKASLYTLLYHLFSFSSVIQQSWVLNTELQQVDFWKGQMITPSTERCLMVSSPEFIE